MKVHKFKKKETKKKETYLWTPVHFVSFEMEYFTLLKPKLVHFGLVTWPEIFCSESVQCWAALLPTVLHCPSHCSLAALAPLLGDTPCWKALPKHTLRSPVAQHGPWDTCAAIGQGRTGTSVNSSLSSQGWPGIQCNVLSQSQLKAFRSIREKQNKEVFPFRQHRQVNVTFLVKACSLILQVIRNLALCFSRRKTMFPF